LQERNEIPSPEKKKEEKREKINICQRLCTRKKKKKINICQERKKYNPLKINIINKV
jgi:hypothetical protein